MTFDPQNEADPLKNGFGSLEILNEEILSPKSGFTVHTRKNMIVVTYVRDGMMIHIGPLEKPDFMMTSDFQWAKVTPDKNQYAFNASESEDAHIFQCGFSPRGGIFESTGEIKKLFTHAERKGILKLIASSDGRESSLAIRQDIEIYSTLLYTGNHMIHEISPNRSAWLQVVKGHVRVNDFQLQTGDGAGFSDERTASFIAQIPTEILIFELSGKISGEAKTKLKNENKSI